MIITLFGKKEDKILEVSFEINKENNDKAVIDICYDNCVKSLEGATKEYWIFWDLHKFEKFEDIDKDKLYNMLYE